MSEKLSSASIYLTIRETADLLQVSERTIHRWTKAGLRVVKIGQITRIYYQDLENFLNSQKENSQQNQG
ncbi:helix-turn-helix domain-containing protein [Fodinicurvata fenggangensis]|uniref:helix-turn-helix domain-containing protein n=1 Tax=Fodinicurvata fenggangensis TaxID=1121830 RepID=UPI00047C901A|nr:helix-turn-helix domain-containing protein [Fodinicurvata fenggangensis]